MRHICIALTIILALAYPLSAQEEVPLPEVPNPCEGTWVLHYNGNWSASRKEDGLTKSIPVNATIFDCGNQSGELQEYMNNVKAVVRCSNSSEQEGEFHVEEIQIICE